MKKQLYLASSSPRRKQLLEEIGVSFELWINEVEEIVPDEIKGEKVPYYLAQLKAEPYISKVIDGQYVITADTSVILDDAVFGKPKGDTEAKEMLLSLSGKSHKVVTAFCIVGRDFKYTESVITNVYFKNLSISEISYYIKTFKPFDKAGAYGIQEWIGAIGIEKIVGSYTNVVGLPTKEVYQALKEIQII